MDEQSRRTNILVGDEILIKIDDSKNVTHQNGVMRIDVTDLPHPLPVGNPIQLSYDSINRAPMFKYEQDPWKTLASTDDIQSGGGAATWDTLTGKPDTFPPAVHTHPEYEGGGGSATWDTLTGKPNTFPPDSHNHTMGDMDFDSKRAFFYDFLSENLLTSIQLLPTASMDNYIVGSNFHLCDGAAISRQTEGGRALQWAGCPYGTGDGVSTVNVPTLTSPLPNAAYYIYIGRPL